MITVALEKMLYFRHIATLIIHSLEYNLVNYVSKQLLIHTFHLFCESGKDTCDIDFIFPACFVPILTDIFEVLYHLVKVVMSVDKLIHLALRCID